MRSNEFLTENVQQIKSFNPYDQDWQFIVAPRNFNNEKSEFPEYIGGDEKLAIGKINDKNIIWYPFRNNTKNGMFFEFNGPINKILPRFKKVEANATDVLAGKIYVKWDRASAANRSKLGDMFLQMSNKISKQFKNPGAVLYRGMVITPAQEKALRAGKRIRVKNSNVSSWTTSEVNAKTFTGTKNGIIIKKRFKQGDIVCHLQALDDFFKLPLKDRWMAENEVLVKGNGIGPYLDPTAVKLSFENYLL